MHTSAILTKNIDALTKPIMQMLETGFYSGQEGYEKDVITVVQIDRIARAVAQEHKRPFVQAYGSITYGEYKRDQNGGIIWVEHDAPKWNHVKLSIPKRKYLSVLVNPLELIGNNRTDIILDHIATYWSYRIYNREIWEEYYKATQTRPEMRAALRLPPL